MKNTGFPWLRFVHRCLGLCVDGHLRETITEDMEDRYLGCRERRGPFFAGMILFVKLALILTVFAIKSLVWRMIMWKNYLKIALRNMRRHRVYSFINIAGLAVGIACTLVILLWVRDEKNFDRFHEKGDRIYRVVFSTTDDGTPTNANGAFGIGPALERDFPEVQETFRIRKMGQSVKRYVGYKDNKFYETRFFFAEPALFSVFDFPLVEGDPSTALGDPNSIVLTEETAARYFGDEEPLGKIIEADPYNDGELMFFRVTGIAKDVPAGSHLHFDFLASYCSQRENTDDFQGFHQHFTYVLLNSPSAATILESKLADFLHRNWTEDPWYTLSLQPLHDIHLRSRLKSEIESNGNILYVYIFSAIAIFVLIIACINFMNLATAWAVKRAKEVGVRKVVGARRNQLLHQFLGESILLCLCSALAAFLMVLPALPLFNSFAGKTLSLHSLFHPPFILLTAAIILLVGLASGLYPAFILSSFQPASSLKNRSSGSSAGSALRKGLVVFQFALSIGIISATLIVHKQMRFIRTHNLGYDREQILVIPLNKDLRQNYQGFRNELMKHPGIENVTSSSLVPTRGSMHAGLVMEGREDFLSQVFYYIDREFIDTYGIKILAGKNITIPITPEGTADFLVSRLTTAELGLPSYEEALGKRISVWQNPGRIAGVVDDINLYSLHRQPYSITYAITPIESHYYVSLRIFPQNLSDTLAHIRTTWQRMIPYYPLDYFFLDDSFEQMHQSDRKMGDIFSVFSLLAVLVACLGLFGLAAHTAEQKTKEIGMRKILGASTSDIYLLLSREFLKWVALANLIAWPAAYYLMHRWLQNFAFRIMIGWEIFPIAGSAALAVSILTVSLQSIKSASTSPVNSLRYE